MAELQTIASEALGMERVFGLEGMLPKSWSKISGSTPYKLRKKI